MPLFRRHGVHQRADGRFAVDLAPEERALLARISSIVRFNRGEVIYREGDAAETAFNIISGIIITTTIISRVIIITIIIAQSRPATVSGCST